MSTTIIKQASGHYAIDGELNMQTVPDVATQLHELVNQIDGKNITLDLASVSRSESAGVALLVEAMQLAKSADLSLDFANLPPQMKDIADVSGLLELLPIRKN